MIFQFLMHAENAKHLSTLSTLKRKHTKHSSLQTHKIPLRVDINNDIKFEKRITRVYIRVIAIRVYTRLG